MKVHYITNVPYPSGAASSVQIGAMLNGFKNIDSVDDVYLYAPYTKERIKGVKHFLGVKSNIERKRRYLLLFWRFIVKGPMVVSKADVIFTRDPFFILTRIFVRNPIIVELHRQVSGFYWFAFRLFRVRVITISNGIVPKFKCKVLVAHDAADTLSKEVLEDLSREILSEKFEWLKSDKKIVLHTGSVYKGSLEEFLKLPSKMPSYLFVHVGGSREEIEELKAKAGSISNLYLHWAVDYLTARVLQYYCDYLFYYNNPESAIASYTSPLKLFEYLATNKVIVGNNYGSVSEILPKGTFISIDEFVNEEFMKSSFTLKKANIPFHSWTARCKYILENVT